MLTVGATAATAQTKYYTEKATDNIFISAGFGGQYCLNSDNFDYKIKDLVTPHATLSVGKWIDPVWGFRGQAAGWVQKLRNGRNAGTYTVDSDGNAHRTTGEIRTTRVYYGTFHLDGLLNWSNLLYGYNPKRVFQFSTFLGPGLNFTKDRSEEKYEYGTDGRWERDVKEGSLKPVVYGTAGFIAGVRLNKYLEVNLEAKADLSPSVFGKYSGSNYSDASASVTMGLTYTFGGKRFVTCPAIDEDAINEEINRYKAEIARLEAENKAAKGRVVKEVVTKEVQVPIAGPRAVFFRIGKAELDDFGRVNVRLLAQIIKAYPNKVYKIAGYADRATGSAKRNQELSDRRARTVYNALIKEGVKPEQLELTAHGGTENMFGKNFLNRVVIME